MPDLKPCRFCGDASPEMKSGPCTHTRPDLFMAQVHCSHCGATGTRLCGEETLAWAEFSARRYWNDAHPAPQTTVDRIASTAEDSTTFALMALAISYGLYDGVHGEAFAGFLVGSASLRMVLAVISALRRRRDRKATEAEIAHALAA